MRSVLSSVVVLFTFISFGQKGDLQTVQAFWDNNIQEIVRLDKVKIIEHTHFPVDGSWGYAVDYNLDPADWTDELFKDNLDKIFDESLRAVLKGMDYNQLVHHRDENGALNFMIQLFFETEIDGTKLESSTILFFKCYNQIWKLYKIEYIG